MTDSLEGTLEAQELQRIQLFTAIQAAQGRPVEYNSGQGATLDLDGLPNMRDSMRLRPNVSFARDTVWGSSSLSRTRSAIRGPITDRRGLGTLAPYVLPGLLRRASMGLDSQMSALQVFSNQQFPEDTIHEGHEARPFTSPAAYQQPQLQSGKRNFACLLPEGQHLAPFLTTAVLATAQKFDAACLGVSMLCRASSVF